jgi:hypothetical protein
MRGLLRCQFKLQQWSEAAGNASELLQQKGIAADDKMMANMVIAKITKPTMNCSRHWRHTKMLCHLASQNMLQKRVTASRKYCIYKANCRSGKGEFLRLSIRPDRMTIDNKGLYFVGRYLF